MKHTELPWFADNGDREIWGIFDDNGEELAYLVKLPWMVSSKDFNESKANAEFIVRACNSHYELVEALKEAVGLIRIMHGEPVWDIYYNNSPEMQRIKKAFAKAKGKE